MLFCATLHKHALLTQACFKGQLHILQLIQHSSLIVSAHKSATVVTDAQQISAPGYTDSQ